MFDFHLLVFGIGNKSAKGQEKIKSSVHNYLTFSWGYDLLQSRYFSLYPYAGLGWRKSQLHYSVPVAYTPGFSEINELIADQRSIKLHGERFGYLAGAAFDVHLPGKKTPDAITILFIKAGINRSFRKEYYSPNNHRYDTGMRQGDWSLALGFKFVGRK
jgi:hypothetical protein